jgi:hypothetical protein
MSLPPSEIPQGAIRFNTDSQRLEFYAQGEWWVMSTDTPNLGTSGDSTPGGRGLFGGGRLGSPSPGTLSDTIDYINIASTGDAIDFGNLTVARRRVSACASSTRGLWGGGYSPDKDTIDFVTIASTGNATDFGNLSVSRRTPGSTSNATRGIWAGGTQGAGAGTFQDVIDYVTIAATGNAVDFGNLTVARDGVGGCGNSVRGIFAGAYITPGRSNIMDFITITTLGNATDFGDLTVNRSQTPGASSPIRGVWAGGYTSPGSPGAVDTIDYVQIMSTGNAMDFGDLSTSFSPYANGISNCIRAVFGGGYIASPGRTNRIEYVNISTQGNAVDFGDRTVSHASGGACSNSHGGL